MGTMTDAMQSVVDEIRSSTQERSAARRELGHRTRSYLAEVRTTRRNTSATSRRTRSWERDMRSSADRTWREEARMARKEQARGFREGVLHSLEELAVTVSETRSDTHNLLKRCELERSDAAYALRKWLSSEREVWSAQDMARREEAQRLHGDIRRSLEELAGHVGDLRADTRGVVEACRWALEETASDLREAQRVWRERWEREVRRPASPKGASRPPKVKAAGVEALEEPPKADPAPATAQAQVLAVVRGHSEGIRLVEIGNELGVNWRTLIGPTKDLTDAGTIEKIDKTYYPVD